MAKKTKHSNSGKSAGDSGRVKRPSDMIPPEALRAVEKLITESTNALDSLSPSEERQFFQLSDFRHSCRGPATATVPQLVAALREFNETRPDGERENLLNVWQMHRLFKRFALNLRH